MGRRRCSLWKNPDMLIVRLGLLCPRLESCGSQVQRGPLNSIPDDSSLHRRSPPRCEECHERLFHTLAAIPTISFFSRKVGKSVEVWWNQRGSKLLPAPRATLPGASFRPLWRHLVAAPDSGYVIQAWASFKSTPSSTSCSTVVSPHNVLSNVTLQAAPAMPRAL